MLQQPRLLGNLQQFCDAGYSAFRHFPPTRTDARTEWAHAFADYASVIEEVIARPPPPADSHPSLDLSGVEAAFFTDLDLLASLSAADAAIDFAGAWRQGILAIKPTPAGATDSTSALYVFLSFTNVTPQHDALQGRLTILFQSPSSDAVTRLGEIAAAFHDATRGLTASMNVTVGTTTSGNMVSVR